MNAIVAVGGGAGPWAAGRSPSRVLALLAAFGAANRAAVSSAVAGATVAALRERDPGAWRVLFTEEMAAIYRYALSRVGSAADAEDLASQVFEEAWRSAHSLEDVGLPPRAWLFGIARNVVSGHRRRLFRRPPQVAIEAYDGSGNDPALAPDLIDLARAIARLSGPQAEVISLRFIHGLSLQETASVLKTTADGVKGRQARALAALRDLLGGTR